MFYRVYGYYQVSASTRRVVRAKSYRIGTAARAVFLTKRTFFNLSCLAPILCLLGASPDPSANTLMRFFSLFSRAHTVPPRRLTGSFDQHTNAPFNLSCLAPILCLLGASPDPSANTLMLLFNLACLAPILCLLGASRMYSAEAMSLVPVMI
jgi:hypothetical protein